MKISGRWGFLEKRKAMKKSIHIPQTKNSNLYLKIDNQRCRDDDCQIEIGKNISVNEEDTGMKLDKNASQNITNYQKYKEKQE